MLTILALVCAAVCIPWSLTEAAADFTFADVTDDQAQQYTDTFADNAQIYLNGNVVLSSASDLLAHLKKKGVTSMSFSGEKYLGGSGDYLIETYQHSSNVAKGNALKIWQKKSGSAGKHGSPAEVWADWECVILMLQH